MRTAALSSVLAGVALALLGPFILTRGISFSGLAVSQVAALGTVVGAYFSFHYGEYGLALFFVAGAMLLINFLSNEKRLPPESWVGAVYILGAGIAVLLLSKAAHGESHTMGIFFGNVLSSGWEEVAESGGLLLVTLLLLSIFYHRWIWLAFDRDAAEVSGHRPEFWNFVFLLIFSLAMTISIHIFGVLLAFSYLILPAALGLLLFNRMRALLIFIPLYTSVVTVGGFYASFILDFPVGPFLASFLAAALLLAEISRIVLKKR